MEIIDLKNTKERMDERLAMMHKLYLDAKPTNADCIRAMTDEELATWIYMNRWNDIESILEWLKQKAADKDGAE